MTSVYRVTSEIFTESDNASTKSKEGNTMSKFFFTYPSHLLEHKAETGQMERDDDGKLIANGKKEGILLIEHSISTELQLVGLQVWRGAFLLADYILNNPDLFKQKRTIELGSGVGLTSIVTSFFAKEVICTDINMGGILKLIERNIARNKSYVKSEVYISELNFLDLNWSKQLQEKLNNVNIILAADVIYDDEVTEGFVKTLAKLLDSKPPKVAYVSLEKRYVFTIADLDSVAPMYEEFLRCIQRQNVNWNITQVKLDFPQYFRYDRVQQMILMKIENRISRDDSKN